MRRFSRFADGLAAARPLVSGILLLAALLVAGGCWGKKASADLPAPAPTPAPTASAQAPIPVPSGPASASEAEPPSNPERAERVAEFLEAIEDEHWETAQALLKRDPGIAKSRTANGSTPLHWAALRGRVQAVKWLLAAGANPNAPDRDAGVTPLHAAALDGQTEAAKLLLDAKANPNAVDKQVGATPLHVAARRDQAEMASLLIDRGANPNARFSDGTTPLHTAASQGSVNVAAVLIDRGANLEAPQFRRRNAAASGRRQRPSLRRAVAPESRRQALRPRWPQPHPRPARP
jgi:hypothetical protein